MRAMMTCLSIGMLSACAVESPPPNAGERIGDLTVTTISDPVTGDFVTELRNDAKHLRATMTTREDLSASQLAIAGREPATLDVAMVREAVPRFASEIEFVNHVGAVATGALTSDIIVDNWCDGEETVLDCAYICFLDWAFCVN
jgi:hypothetical protein